MILAHLDGGQFLYAFCAGAAFAGIPAGIFLCGLFPRIGDRCRQWVDGDPPPPLQVIDGGHQARTVRTLPPRAGAFDWSDFDGGTSA